MPRELNFPPGSNVRGATHTDIPTVVELLRASEEFGIGAAILEWIEHRAVARATGTAGLSTDSRTGALDLYLDMGMVVRASHTPYSKLLLPSNPIGRDL